MSEKVWFPGAKTVEQKEAEKAAAVEKYEKAQRKKQEQEERDDLMIRFEHEFNKKALARLVTLSLGFNALFVGIKAINSETTPGQDVIKEYYHPHFHGAKVESTKVVMAHEGKEINSMWAKHMNLLVVEALLVAIIVFVHLAKNCKARKDIDVMLAIKKAGKVHKINPKLLKKMIRVAPEILRHMSAEHTIYFDVLAQNGFDKCTNNKKVYDMAKNVLEGYLLTHPNDRQLVLELFDQDSLPLCAYPEQNVR